MQSLANSTERWVDWRTRRFIKLLNFLCRNPWIVHAGQKQRLGRRHAYAIRSYLRQDGIDFDACTCVYWGVVRFSPMYESYSNYDGRVETNVRYQSIMKCFETLSNIDLGILRKLAEYKDENMKFRTLLKLLREGESQGRDFKGMTYRRRFSRVIKRLINLGLVEIRMPLGPGGMRASYVLETRGVEVASSLNACMDSLPLHKRRLLSGLTSIDLMRPSQTLINDLWDIARERMPKMRFSE